MQKAKRSKVMYIIAIVSLILVTLAITGLTYSFSKNASLFGITNDNNRNDRVAYMHVQVDGLDSNVINFKAYATTKLSDIEKVGNTYKANSFKEGAYQLHTITVTNDSEVPVSCNLTTTTTTNDDRVFYAVIPNVNDDVISSLYSENTLNTISDVRNYINSISLTNDIINSQDTKTYSMIIWSEHDSVYVDANNDGIADEEGKTLAELANGIPSETYTLDYVFDQLD
jgi:flagellar basal body-associated protein FliL